MSASAATGPLGQTWISNGTVVHSGRYIADLAESVPWWNITQGGVAARDGILLGILIGDTDRVGEHLSSTTIITRLATQVSNNRSLAESRLDATYEAIQSKRPVGVVVTKDHRLLQVPFPGEESYALMGFWIPTAIFNVFSRNTDNQVVKTPMIRLDKIDQNGIWWRSPQQIATDLQSASNDKREDTCPTCQQRGPVILEQPSVFLCGNRTCADNTNMTNPYMLSNQITYHPSFLNWRPSMANIMASPAYLPPLLSMPQSIQELDDVIANDPKRRPMWSGYLCHICQALNQRTHVSEVGCHKCGNIQHAPPPPLTFEEVSHSGWFNIQDNTNIDALGVRIRGGTTLMQTPMDPDYVVRQWKLHPDIDGHVLMMYPKRHVMFGPGGSKDIYNTLYDRLQNGQLNYQRMVTASPVRGQMTRWFGQNIGEPYIGTVFESADTNLTLNEAPQVYRDILRNLDNLIVSQTGQQPQFNELLAMCYFPNMSMGWHADGEQSILGHAVASQSLGGTAIMTFGVSERAWIGQAAGGGIDPSVPIFPGCPKHDERVALKARADRGEITPAQHADQLQALLHGLRPPTNPVWCLQFPLTSGSIMAQIGPLINTHWKHKVDFIGTDSRIRFVNTARSLNAHPDSDSSSAPATAPTNPNNPRTRRRSESDSDPGPPASRRRTSTGGRRRGSGRGRGTRARGRGRGRGSSRGSTPSSSRPTTQSATRSSGDQDTTMSGV